MENLHDKKSELNLEDESNPMLKNFFLRNEDQIFKHKMENGVVR